MMQTIPTIGDNYNNEKNAASTNKTVKSSLDDVIVLSILREESKVELFDILNSLRGNKYLIIDNNLINSLNIIVKSNEMKDNNVISYNNINDNTITTTNNIPENIIYLIRANLSLINTIAQQIKSYIRNGYRSQFHIYFVPTQSTVCIHLLEEQINNKDIWDKISFGEYRMGLIPFDTDLLSLEMDGVFKQCYVDGDLSSLNTIALSLLKLQFMYGIIPNIKSKGLGAKKILQKMMRLRVEEADTERQQMQINSLLQGAGSIGNGDAVDGISQVAGAAHQIRSEIDTLVIVDREIDLISPLVTPLTYEGLIDDTLGIEHGRILVDASVIGSDDQQDALSAKMAAQAAPNDAAASAAAASAAAAAKAAAAKAKNPDEKIPVILNNDDEIYAEIRNLSIESLGAFLQEKAIEIRKRYTSFKENKDASLTEIHDFVKKIPKLTREFKALNQHINIASLLKQRTDTRDFREQWHGERAMLEGEPFLDSIEEMLYADTRRKEMHRILRLLCLQSLTGGGIRANKYDSIRKTIAQLYGFEHLFTLSNLERSGLIRRKDTIIVVETTNIWNTLRKQLRLIDENVSMINPTDISYVSAGYAPLLVRLVQSLGHAACNNSWTALLDVMKLLPGPLLEFTQLQSQPEELSEALQRSASEAVSSNNNTSSTGFGANTLLSYTGIMSGNNTNDISNMKSNNLVLTDSSNSEKKVMMVFVVGGLSFIEIAAFRFLSRDPAFPYRIILATTKLVTGNTFIESLQYSVHGSSVSTKVDN